MLNLLFAPAGILGAAPAPDQDRNELFESFANRRSTPPT